MISEETIPFLSNLMPSIQFVEVEAMNMNDNPDYVLMVNPKPKPLALEEAPKEEVPNAD
jgi:hypothetical protein